MAVDVLELIAERVAGSAALRAALPGGLVPGRARDDPPRPYGTANVVSEVPGWTTEAAYGEQTRVQISIFADTVAAARAAARAVARADPDGLDHLVDAPLDDGAVAAAVRIGGACTLDPESGPGGSRTWVAMLDYLFQVHRSE